MDLTGDDCTRDGWRLLQTMKKIGHRVNAERLREKTGLSQKRFDRAWQNLQDRQAVRVNGNANCALDRVGRQALLTRRRGWLRPFLRAFGWIVLTAIVTAIVVLLVQRLFGRELTLVGTKKPDEPPPIQDLTK